MSGLEPVTIEVLPAADDPDELAALTTRLRSELLETDVDAVEPLDDASAPPGDAKGLGTLAGWLLVRLATTAHLRELVASVRGWAARTNRAVEITWDGDVLKVTGVTSEQQERLIDAWLARHAPGP